VNPRATGTKTAEAAWSDQVIIRVLEVRVKDEPDKLIDNPNEILYANVTAQVTGAFTTIFIRGMTQNADSLKNSNDSNDRRQNRNFYTRVDPGQAG
jgi:hypothetical protein